ncbi:MAG: SIS domain-containing protein, partial [Sciscionella sp.]
VHIGATTTWFDRHGARIPAPARLPIVVPHAAVELDGSADFTAKEIAEQPRAAAHLVDTLSGRLAGGELLRDLGVPTCRRVRMVACGSSYYAARIAAGMFASMAGVPASVVIASELAAEVTEPGTLNIAFSQSGETADVLAAMDVLSGPWLAITNNPQASLARRSDAVLGLGCGPEVGVAATKSFTAQVVAAAALATSFGSARRRLSRHQVRSVEQLLGTLPERLATTDERVAASAMALADELADTPAWLFVSRGLGVPYAMEGALKLKELSYRWVEALPAGELKHGPIALIQSGTPVVVVQSEPAERLAVSVSEMAARGARIITVGTGPGVELPVELAQPKQPPWGPLEAVVAMQHLAREVAVRLGKAVDRPRNLAKSVTVE